MSHSSHETARALQNSVRWVAKRHRHPIGILADLQGPKFRVGEFAGGRVFVNDGAIFRFDRTDKPGSSEGVFLPHPQIFAAVEPGHMLLLRVPGLGGPPRRIDPRCHRRAGTESGAGRVSQTTARHKASSTSRRAPASATSRMPDRISRLAALRREGSGARSVATAACFCRAIQDCKCCSAVRRQESGAPRLRFETH